MQSNPSIFLLLSVELLASWFQHLDAFQRKPASYPSRCLLPVNKGKCKAAFPSFYFDSKARICKPFKYGGCDGNANNFDNLPDCIWTCERFDVMPSKCKLPLAKGRGRYKLKRYYYDFQARTCSTYIYTGFGGNANSFLNFEECFQDCGQYGSLPERCKLPPDEGYCKAKLPRYYYSMKDRVCQFFYYRGCQGNENNFRDEIDCIRECESYAPYSR